MLKKLWRWWRKFIFLLKLKLHHTDRHTICICLFYIFLFLTFKRCLFFFNPLFISLSSSSYFVSYRYKSTTIFFCSKNYLPFREIHWRILQKKMMRNDNSSSSRRAKTFNLNFVVVVVETTTTTWTTFFPDSGSSKESNIEFWIGKKKQYLQQTERERVRE